MDQGAQFFIDHLWICLPAGAFCVMVFFIVLPLMAWEQIIKWSEAAAARKSRQQQTKHQ